MKFLDLFAGIGGFRLGLEQYGHECVGYVEWDKFARKSYQAIHDTRGEWTIEDIRSATDDDFRHLRGLEIDMLCGGFPCQSFSIAGLRRGYEDTRGTMFFEIARFTEQIKPRFLLLENVKGLLSHEKGKTFATMLSILHDLGYDAEWQVCNSKDFGVPHNRERIFIVAHLRGRSGGEIFPLRRHHGSTPIQIIGSTAPEFRTIGARDFVYSPEGSMGTILATDYKQPKQIIVVGNIYPSGGQSGDIIDPDGISSCLDSMQGGNRMPKIRIKENTKKGYADAEVGDSVNFTNEHSKTRRGRVGKQVANTLETHINQGVVMPNYRIRKLTPRECWRLQAFPDWAFDKAREVNSDSQLYKQSGNSVTVSIIAEIGRVLKEIEENEQKDTSCESR
jgi:DNA (cytosine-5)-methyltransferase 1